MRLNTLKPAEGSKKKSTRVGRGWSSGLGKTCGKGQKGQTSRGKGKVAIGFEGGQMPFHRRIPKSGFTSKKSLTTRELRLSELNNIAVDEIDLPILIALDVFDQNVKNVKIIATGVIERAITVRGLRVTAAAREAIIAAGRKVEI